MNVSLTSDEMCLLRELKVKANITQLYFLSREFFDEANKRIKPLKH